MAKIKHTTQTLRNTLFDEMESLVGGHTTEGRAHAVARLANAIVSTSRLEIDHAGGIGTHVPNGPQPVVLVA